MLYNTQYNVSVTATLCGHGNATNSTVIQYGNHRIIASYSILLLSAYRNSTTMHILWLESWIIIVTLAFFWKQSSTMHGCIFIFHMSSKFYNDHDHVHSILISFLYTVHCDSLLTNTMTSTDTITIISGTVPIPLFYIQCSLLSTDTIMITVPSLQGHNITFSCFGNEFLSVCSEGGYWDPDPVAVCQSKNFVSNCLLWSCKKMTSLEAIYFLKDAINPQ